MLRTGCPNQLNGARRIVFSGDLKRHAFPMKPVPDCSSFGGAPQVSIGREWAKAGNIFTPIRPNGIFVTIVHSISDRVHGP